MRARLGEFSRSVDGTRLLRFPVLGVVLGAKRSSRRILAGIAWPLALVVVPHAGIAWPHAVVCAVVCAVIGAVIGAPHAGSAWPHAG